MRIHKLEYKETGSFSKLIEDYIDDAPELKPFYSYRPDLEGIRVSIKDLSDKSFDRSQLSASLLNQYRSWGLKNEQVITSISALNDEKTFAVVTAHQPCLLTGPLYFVIKIAAAIKLAKELTQIFKNEGFNFVPVYWMGAEDHDFEEISHARVFSKSIQWNHPKAQGPVGRLSVEGLDSVVEELSEVLGSAELDQKLLNAAKSSYLEAENYGAATARFVDFLFGEEGLIILQQDDQSFKSLMKEVFEQELFGESSNFFIADRMKSLEAGYHNQAHSRDINLFLLEDGKRQRIERKGDDFVLVDSEKIVTAEQMRKLVSEHPEKLSPNVILRPVFQQMLLPAPVFIGGGSEVAYWMQLQPLFDKFSVHFPVLLLRNSLMYIDNTSLKKMHQTGVEVNDLFKDVDHLLREFVEEKAGDEVSLGKEKGQIVGLFKQIANSAAEIDPGLKKSVQAEEQKALKSLSTIEDKIIRAQKKRFEVEVNKIRGLKDRLFPNGHLQERKDNFIPVYLRSGGTFIKDLIEYLEPLDLRFTVMIESD